MAKYKVSPNDSYAKVAKKMGISPQKLIRANPGVPTLSTGMEIKLPNVAKKVAFSPLSPPDGGIYSSVNRDRPNGPTGFNPNRFDNQPNPYLGINTTYAPNAFNAGLQIAGTMFGVEPTVNPAITNRSRGMNADYGAGVPGIPGMPAPYSQLAAQGAYGIGATPYNTTTANSFTSGGQVNLQNTQVPSSAPRPTTPYTGDPNDPNTALWKATWDAEARAGKQPSQTAPPVKYGKGGKYNSLREARQAQMRNRAENQAAAGEVVQAIISAPAEIGNNVNTSLNWRVG